MSKGGGSDPRWRGDGKELFYKSPDGMVMAVAVTAGPVFQAGTPKSLFRLPGLGTQAMIPATDGNRFLYPVFVQQGSPSPFTVVLNWQTGLKK